MRVTLAFAVFFLLPFILFRVLSVSFLFFVLFYYYYFFNPRDKVSVDKKLKKAALDNALQALADPAKAAKVDPVSQVFVQYWRQKAADMEKNKDKVLLYIINIGSYS